MTNVTSIKAKWAGKILRSKNFVVVTDTEATIFSERVNAERFDSFINAQSQLATMRKFQTVFNKTVRDFEVQMNKKFGKSLVKKTGGSTNARKINVKVSK